ncbi:flagellar hook-associated protein FlgL [Paenibacillaceae bacterium]|nr:flagellar hook-associated protein FlgL [Paenibacillaceae bacterium]
MRVTQTMMSAQLLRNVSNNLGRMNTLQDQLSSGKRINAPSDDPVGMTFSMRYRSELASNEQYVKNADTAASSLEFTDTALDQAVNVLQRTRELMVQGATGAMPQTAYDAIQKEIGELYNQLIEIGNSKFNGKYMFNGEETETPPYPKVSSDSAVTPKAQHVGTDPGKINYELSPAMTMSVNLTGNEIFGEPVTDDSDVDSDNVFHVLSRVVEALGNGQNEQVSELLGKIDTRMNAMLEQRAEVGARMNRVAMISGRLEEMGINLTSIQSKTEDADLAEVITNLKVNENIYQASLSAGAKIIMPSLVDFLR